LTLKTPRETCSILRAIPKPCMGSRLSVLRMSMSSVPWITSVLGASIKARLRCAHVDCQDVIAKLKCRNDRREANQSCLHRTTARVHVVSLRCLGSKPCVRLLLDDVADGARRRGKSI